MINELQKELDDLMHQRVQGAIIRSRSNWAELGERNSAFFLNLEKHNFNKKTITQIRNPINGEIVTNQAEIMKVLNSFFKKVFRKSPHQTLDPDYLGVISLPQVSERDKYMAQSN